MIRIRRPLALAAVLAVLVGVFVPAPALAVEPLPPPVAEAAGVPSQVARSVTNTPLGDKTVWMLRAMAQQNLFGNVPGQVVSAAPKPITPPSTFARGAGGLPLIGFYAGWGIGTAGLNLYGLGTGTSYETLICQTASDPTTAWFPAVNDFIALGFAPDCVAGVPITSQNGDKNAVVSLGTYLTGASITGSASNPRGAFCWSGGQASAPDLVPGVAESLQFQQDNNAWSGIPWPSVASSGNVWNCTPGWLLRALTEAQRLQNQAGDVPDFRIVRTDTNVSVLQSTSTRPDPQRQADCQIDWADGTITYGDGHTYRESAGGLPATAAGLGCKTAWDAKPGAGNTVIPDRIRVGSEDDQGVRTIISDQEVPDFTPDQGKGLQQGNGHGLVLQKVINSVVRSCMTWEVDCAQWWTQTDSGTSPTTAGGTYRCTYGGESIALAECGIYRNTFDTQTNTPTVTDPATGQPVPWPNPSAQPSTGTGTGTFPQTGTNPGTAASTATGGGGCTAGWSWNPVDWVLNPLRCAFIPSRAKVDQFNTTMQTTWNASRPGQLSAAVMSVSPALAAIDAGNCGGMIVPVPVPDSAGEFSIENHALLAACPGDFFAPVAPLFFWFISGSLVIAGFFAVKRSLDKFVGNA